MLGHNISEIKQQNYDAVELLELELELDVELLLELLELLEDDVDELDDELVADPSAKTH